MDTAYAEQIELRQDTQSLAAIALADVPQATLARELFEEKYEAYSAARVARGATPAPEIVLARTGSLVQDVLPEAPVMAQLPGLEDVIAWLDTLLPEEMIGLDITPGVRVGKETKGRVYYDNVWIEDGKVKTIRKGEPRTLGYTPRFAKKKYRTKRRRKRLTKRDMYILEVLKTNPQAGALALML